MIRRVPRKGKESKESKESKKEELKGGDSTTEEKENVFLKINTDDEDTENQIIKFNDTDSILTGDDKKEEVEAPKNIDFLEELNKKRELESKINQDDDDDDDEKLVLGDDIPLSDLDFSNISESIDNKPDILLDNLEILN